MEKKTSRRERAVAATNKAKDLKKKIKFRAKDFSKAAWSSRLTAPTTKVELVTQCRNLPKKDLLSQADAFCALWSVPTDYRPIFDSNGMPSKLPGRQEKEIGKTEIARASVDPVFDHRFKLTFTFHEEQVFVMRVYDEDLRYATDLKEHDYLGGCIFTLGQLMGAKGCTIAKPLAEEKSYLLIRGEEIIETREVLEFRFSCQDLMKEQSLIDQSKVLDKSNPYFHLERLNPDDQSWQVVWKSEVIKDSLSPTWKEARLPLQLLCNDNKQNPLKITIWDYERHSNKHDLMGYVESSISELVTKGKEGIQVHMVMRENTKWFSGRKPKIVGLLKVLKASVIKIPSMLQYLSGGCSLDLMVGIDCSIANAVVAGTGQPPGGAAAAAGGGGGGGVGAPGIGRAADVVIDPDSLNNMHHSASHWLNDYQAGIQKLGTVVENFARGNHSLMWGFGAKLNDQYQDKFLMGENMFLGKDLLRAYDRNVVQNSSFELGEPALLKPIIQAATFRTIRSCKRRQCYTILCIFTAGNIADLHDTVDLICTAAEDAPLSLVIVGVGNRDFSELAKLKGDESGLLKDSRAIPMTRQIVNFVSFKQFGGNAAEVIAEALKGLPEQFVEYHVTNGIKPLPPVPAPDFDVAVMKAAAAAAAARKKKIKNAGSKSANGGKGAGGSRSKSKSRNRGSSDKKKKSSKHDERKRKSSR